MLEVFVDHFKSLEMWTLKYLKLWTISTIDPMINRGAGVWPLPLKSTTSSFVFPTLIQRLFFSHQSTRSFTSCQYCDSSLWDVSRTTVVSSANFTIWLPGCLAEQSYVNSVYSRGLRTDPLGELVLNMMGEEKSWILTVCGWCVKKSRTQLQREGVNQSSGSLLARVCVSSCIRGSKTMNLYHNKQNVNYTSASYVLLRSMMTSVYGKTYFF